MHGQRTPSPPSARPGYQPSTPSAPYLYTTALPPSPQTPSNRHLPPAVPRAPYMNPVPLPGHPSSHGPALPTPPGSPEKAASSNFTLNPKLMQLASSPVPLLTDPRAFMDPRIMQKDATAPSTSVLYIHVDGHVITIQGAHGASVTVGDVLYQLYHACKDRYRSQDERRQLFLTGLIPTSRAGYFNARLQ